MTTRSKSEFQFNTLSGYSQTKTEKEKEMDKRLFHGRKAGVAKMSVHGFYEDNSMAANDRKELRNQMKLKRKQSSMNRLQTNFELEVQKVQALQRKLAARQETMAATALEIYTATYLQSVWRGYQSRLFQFKRKTCACVVIQYVYRRYATLQRLRRLAFPSIRARVIQRAYRRRYLRMKAAVRARAHKLWRHVELFAVCRAKKVICPFEKQKRVIYNIFLRFHQKIRARRIFNVANVNKLFLGLYFCQTPLAQKSVKASATYLKVSHRRSSDEYAKRPSSVLPQSQPALNKYIQAALLEARITSALEGAQERQEKESVADTLSYFNKLIKKDGLKNMGKKGANNPLLGGRAGRRAVSPNPSSGQGTTAPPPRMASPKARPPLRKMHSSSEGSSGNTGVSSAKNKVHNPVDRRSKSFIVRSAILESVTTYRKSVQNYMIPPGLINLASYSQLDPNSIFASQQSSETNKVIPYELKGFFRLKTVAEVVFFLQDLSAATMKCPELLNDPFHTINLVNSRKNAKEDFDVNFLPKDKEMRVVESIVDDIETVEPFADLLLLERKGSASTSKPAGGKRMSKRVATKSTPRSSVVALPTTAGDGSGSETNSGRNSMYSGRNSTHASGKNSGLSTPIPLANTRPSTPPGEKTSRPGSRDREAAMLIKVNKDVKTGEKSPNQREVEEVSSRAVTAPMLIKETFATATKDVFGNDTASKTKLPEVKKSISEENGNIFYAQNIKEEEEKFFASIQQINKEVLAQKEAAKSRVPSLSSLSIATAITPQFSQSTATVPDMSFAPPTGHDHNEDLMSQASSMNSDDEEYDDDFDSMSASRSHVNSAAGHRPSKPSTPVPSSAFYRRQNIVLGVKK